MSPLAIDYRFFGWLVIGRENLQQSLTSNLQRFTFRQLATVYNFSRKPKKCQQLNIGLLRKDVENTPLQQRDVAMKDDSS